MPTIENGSGSREEAQHKACAVGDLAGKEWSVGSEIGNYDGALPARKGGVKKWVVAALLVTKGRMKTSRLHPRYFLRSAYARAVGTP